MLKLYKIRVFILLISLLFLNQCTTADNSRITEVQEVKPVLNEMKKKPENPYPLSAAEYLNQAKNQEGSEKQKSLLSAAGRTISDGQWRQSTAILAQTSHLTPVLADEKNILLAQIDVLRGHPKQALDKLSTITEHYQLSKTQQIQMSELLAQSYQNINKPLESITERIKLEDLLLDEASQKNNRRRLWLTLTHLSQIELDRALLEANTQPVLQGWLELALISRKYRDNARSLLAALDHWQTQFPTHSANKILPRPLDVIANKMVGEPKQIALLLPLSGSLQGPGTAVRDGFMAAKKNSGNASIKIKTYDTNKEDVVSLYQTAITEGANYVVGPLIKSQVTRIAALPHPVPTLLLNDAETPVQENSYSFGLSPLNEAAQVAIRGRNKGYSRALIIAPDNKWGSEVLNAFSKQWQKKGGHVVDLFLYSAKDDLNKKMKDFLHISQGHEREKQIKELLGYHIQSIIGRRQDFDMIFLVAYPSKARQIMPLLNYYYAGDVPVFATASVYSGSANALKDKDLEGIIFCDIPWVFGHQMGTRNWPEQFNSYNRLYSLGKDSYLLAMQLNQLMLFPADEWVSGDGILYLKSSQQVARVLEWGQFRQGLVHSLGEVA
jgi:outer membrane PBP1 activator LpoA protein